MRSEGGGRGGDLEKIPEEQIPEEQIPEERKPGRNPWLGQGGLRGYGDYCHRESPGFCSLGSVAWGILWRWRFCSFSYDRSRHPAAFDRQLLISQRAIAPHPPECLQKTLKI